MARLFFIGDSLSLGLWDAGGGWVNRLCRQVIGRNLRAQSTGSGFFCVPYNLGVTGNGGEAVLDRLDAEVGARVMPQTPREPRQIVFSVGVNDSCYLLDQRAPRYTEKAFHDLMEDLARHAAKWAANISFIGFLPVDEARVCPLPWDPSRGFQNERIALFEDILKDVCHARRLAFLPLFHEWAKRPGYEKLLHDGIHPTTEGHALLADKIEGFLLENGMVAFHGGREE